MCQSGLPASPYVPAPVLWSHIGILLHLPAAEPRSTSGLLFPSQYLSGTIWLTPYLMVWDWRVSRAGLMPFRCPSCSLLFFLQLFSLYLLFLYRLVVGAGVFGLIGCQSPSSGLALPIFFNNINNKPAGRDVRSKPEQDCQKAKCYAKAVPVLHHRQYSNWLDVSGKLSYSHTSLELPEPSNIIFHCTVKIKFLYKDFYTHFRNFVTGQIRRSKKDYYEHKFNAAKRDIKRTWRIISNIINTKKS